MRHDHGHELARLTAHRHPRAELIFNIVGALPGKAWKVGPYSGACWPVAGDTGRQPFLGVSLGVDRATQLETCEATRRVRRRARLYIERPPPPQPGPSPSPPPH